MLPLTIALRRLVMATVRKLKSGNYQAILTISTGKRISATGKTQDEALQAVFKLSASGSDTPAPAPNTATAIDPTMLLTVGAVIDRYIDSKCLVLSPTTVEGYKMLRKERFKGLMATPLCELSKEVLQKAVNAESLMVSPKTVRNAYGLITSAVGMFAPDLHLSVTLPRKNKKEIYVPDEEEVAKIYEIVKRYSKGRLIKPYLLATQCGLRASEIAGLTTDCIKSDCIIIKQAKVSTHDGAYIKQPKSNKGYRTIPISPDFSALLLQNCVGDSVCNITSHAITKAWYVLRDTNDLPKHLNFHALRHHFASQCLLQNIPQKYIAELMGHADCTMIERVYQHVFPSALSAYGKRLANRTDTLLGENLKV